MKLTKEELMYFINDKQESDLMLIECDILRKMKYAIQQLRDVATADMIGDIGTSIDTLERECERIVRTSINFKGRC